MKAVGACVLDSSYRYLVFFFFFFQAEDGIRDYKVTGVQTCALPILPQRIAATQGETAPIDVNRRAWGVRSSRAAVFTDPIISPTPERLPNHASVDRKSVV